jgi:hypothetical protein
MILNRTNAILLMMVIALNACVNKDDPTAERPSGNWVFEGMNYSSTNLAKPGNNVHFTASGEDGVWCLFSAQPTTSINAYKIVKGPVASPGANEMVLQVDHGIGDSWYSTGTEQLMATVARDGLGNIRITVPSVNIRHYKNNILQADSTKGSCVLIYK